MPKAPKNCYQYIAKIRTDLTRLREAIDAGYLQEGVYQNYIENLEDPWQYMFAQEHKNAVLLRLKEFYK